MRNLPTTSEALRNRGQREDDQETALCIGCLDGRAKAIEQLDQATPARDAGGDRQGGTFPSFSNELDRRPISMQTCTDGHRARFWQLIQGAFHGYEQCHLKPERIGSH
jgi:hypothetical protein